MLISASTNPPQFADLPAYIARLNDTAVDYIHADVMDGRFVQNTTFSHEMVRKIKRLTSKPLDVHLMTETPNRTYKKYIDAGANILTVHFETFKNSKSLIKLLTNIRRHGCFAGLSFRPDTPVSKILPVVPYCDLLLVMSVIPGESGQKFLPQTYNRLSELNDYLENENLDVVVEVDGGINPDIARELKAKNVQMVVVGSALYTSQDLNKIVQDFKSL